jgi:tetratricopeptide (TPR) repeat protein
MEAFCQQLEEKGFRGMSEGRCVDFCIVDQVHGPIGPCDWFEWGRHSDGFHIGWLAGTEPGAIYVPTGWTVEDSLNLDALEERDATRDRDGLEFVREGDDLDVFRDPSTGEEVYLPKPAVPAGAQSAEGIVSFLLKPGFKECDELAARAYAAEEKLLSARETEDAEAEAAVQRELTEEMLPRAQELLAASDEKAAAEYALGVVLRVSGRVEEALAAVNRAIELAPQAVPALLEMTLCLCDLQRPAEAEAFARRAVELENGSATAWGNLAMVHIQQGDRRNARLALDQALEIDPADPRHRELDERFEEFFP